MAMRLFQTYLNREDIERIFYSFKNTSHLNVSVHIGEETESLSFEEIPPPGYTRGITKMSFTTVLKSKKIEGV